MRSRGVRSRGVRSRGVRSRGVRNESPEDAEDSDEKEKGEKLTEEGDEEPELDDVERKLLYVLDTVGIGRGETREEGMSPIGRGVE